MTHTTNRIKGYLRWLQDGSKPEETFYVEAILRSYLTKPSEHLKGVLSLAVSLEGYDDAMMADHHAQPVDVYTLQADRLIELGDYIHDDYNTYEEGVKEGGAYYDYGRRYYRVM